MFWCAGFRLLPPPMYCIPCRESWKSRLATRVLIFCNRIGDWCILFWLFFSNKLFSLSISWSLSSNWRECWFLASSNWFLNFSSWALRSSFSWLCTFCSLSAAVLSYWDSISNCCWSLAFSYCFFSKSFWLRFSLFWYFTIYSCWFFIVSCCEPIWTCRYSFSSARRWIWRFDRPLVPPLVLAAPVKSKLELKSRDCCICYMLCSFC